MAMKPAAGTALAGTVSVGAEGRFFGVDVDAFRKLCDADWSSETTGTGADLAATYLLLALGTGRTNDVTSWSAQAVQKRLGIRWTAANRLIKALVSRGFIEELVAGRNPKYVLLPANDTRQPLPPLGRSVVNGVWLGKQPKGDEETAAAIQASELGYLSVSDDGGDIPYFSVVRPDRNLVWLPNDIAGMKEGPNNPLNNLRRGRKVEALRLLVDLFVHHELFDDGGIDRKWLRINFTRTERLTADEYCVWEFNRSDTVAWSSGGPLSTYVAADAGVAADSWTSLARDQGLGALLGLLEKCHVLEWVIYLVEDGGREPPLCHPVGLARFCVVKDARPELTSKCREARIGEAATRAAVALLSSYDSSGQFTVEGLIELGPETFMVPVCWAAEQVQLIGIARMRFRPNTKGEARWQSEESRSAQGLIRDFNRITGKLAPHLMPSKAAMIAEVTCSQFSGHG